MMICDAGTDLRLMITITGHNSCPAKFCSAQGVAVRYSELSGLYLWWWYYSTCLWDNVLQLYYTECPLNHFIVYNKLSWP
jgi:hypothetical protein